MTNEDKKKLIATVVGRSAPFIVDHADGSWLYSTEGEKWLDFASGIAVANTGHCHPKVVAAAREQIGKIIHAQANMFYHQPMLDLAAKLVEIVPGGFDNVLFVNSGAEAVENSVKLAKQSTRRARGDRLPGRLPRPYPPDDGADLLEDDLPRSL